MECMIKNSWLILQLDASFEQLVHRRLTTGMFGYDSIIDDTVQHDLVSPSFISKVIKLSQDYDENDEKILGHKFMMNYGNSGGKCKCLFMQYK